MQSRSPTGCLSLTDKSVRIVQSGWADAGVGLVSGVGFAYSMMMTGVEAIPGGVVHDLPPDIKDALRQDPEALATWRDITPLARNEWICWITAAKKPETRLKRVAWGRESLRDGKRRPCCWPGCPHR